MGKVGKISVIPKDFSNAFPTMEKSLREKGLSRMPGTGRLVYPCRELSGKYRTGIDEEAAYIRRMAEINPTDAELEKKRVRAERDRLERLTGLNLGPNSLYYNHTSRESIKVSGYRLIDGDNLFNLDDAYQAITYHWVKSLPCVASSLQAYERGEYPHDTQYFVNDEDVENEILYRKKKTANDAIIRFDSWSLEKRRKVARLLDLPVTEEMKEEIVYNMVDSFLKGTSVLEGSHKGLDPIRVFTSYANLKDDVLYVKDLVDTLIKHNIYKEKKNGRIYEGELEIFKSKEELIEHLLDDKNQEDLFEIENRLKLKRSAQ